MGKTIPTHGFLSREVTRLAGAYQNLRAYEVQTYLLQNEGFTLTFGIMGPRGQLSF